MDNKVIEEEAARGKELLSAYQVVFSSLSGKMVLDDLKAKNFIDDTTAINDNANSNSILIHEGQRRAVLDILTTLKQTDQDIDAWRDSIISETKGELE